MLTLIEQMVHYQTWLTFILFSIILLSKVCDKRGDPCDSLCGGAGCGSCGALSCNQGLVQTSRLTLKFSSDAETTLKRKEASTDDLLRESRESRGSQMRLTYLPRWLTRPVSSPRMRLTPTGLLYRTYWPILRTTLIVLRPLRTISGNLLSWWVSIMQCFSKCGIWALSGHVVVTKYIVE